VTLDE